MIFKNSKHIIFLALILMILISCNEETSKRENVDKQFSQYFGKVDTTMIDTLSTGCSAGFYKQVDSNWVVRISPNLRNLKKDTTFSISIDSINSGILTELLVFENGKANLEGFCSDFITNHPEPIRQFSAARGFVVLHFRNTKGKEEYSYIESRVSIYIKELYFYDLKTKKNVIIKDVLLWNVPDLGTPG